MGNGNFDPFHSFWAVSTQNQIPAQYLKKICNLCRFLSANVIFTHTVYKKGVAIDPTCTKIGRLERT